MNTNNTITTGLLSPPIIGNFSIDGFEMSAQIGKLSLALSKFQREMAPIKKEAHGHRHRYADVNAVLEVVRPLLEKYELSIQQHPHTDSNGNQRIMTILCHSSDQWTRSSFKIVHDDQDVQSLGGGITYQRRYALVSILGIEQEDDDGNAQKKSYEDKKAQFPAGAMPRKSISPDQIETLKNKIRDSKESQDLLQEIYKETKVGSLSSLSEKQFYFVVNKYFPVQQKI